MRRLNQRLRKRQPLPRKVAALSSNPGQFPPTAPLAKVKVGMSEGRLYDLLGQPTESKNYLTGKSWIPFYFGPDTHRKEVLYKGLGRITLKPSGALGTGVYKVFKVTYDPSEDGFVE